MLRRLKNPSLPEGSEQRSEQTPGECEVSKRQEGDTIRDVLSSAMRREKGQFFDHRPTVSLVWWTKSTPAKGMRQVIIVVSDQRAPDLCRQVQDICILETVSVLLEGGDDVDSSKSKPSEDRAAHVVVCEEANAHLSALLVFRSFSAKGG